jgi:membrane protein
VSPHVTRLRQIADGMRDATRRHHASILAGGVAFYAFLSMFPALAALVSGYGLLSDPEHVRRQVDVLAGGLPRDVQAVIYDQMARLTARSSGSLSVEAAIGLVAALWAATKGMRALITGLSLAFGQAETRGFIRLNATAFLFTVGGVLGGAVAVAAIVVLPLVFSFLHLSALGAQLFRWLRWPALAVATLLGLAVAYHFGPARPPGRWRWVTPGALVATALWLTGSALFGWFASRFGKSDLVEGSLAVVITLLTWFLLSAYVVVIGAELNMEIDRTREPRGADRSDAAWSGRQTVSSIRLPSGSRTTDSK